MIIDIEGGDPLLVIKHLESFLNASASGSLVDTFGLAQGINRYAEDVLQRQPDLPLAKDLQRKARATMMGVTPEIFDANPGLEQFINSNYIHEDLARYGHHIVVENGVVKFVFPKGKLSWNTIQKRIPVDENGKMQGYAYTAEGFAAVDTSANQVDRQEAINQQQEKLQTDIKQEQANLNKDMRDRMELQNDAIKLQKEQEALRLKLEADQAHIQQLEQERLNQLSQSKAEQEAKAKLETQKKADEDAKALEAQKKAAEEADARKKKEQADANLILSAKDYATKAKTAADKARNAQISAESAAANVANAKTKDVTDQAYKIVNDEVQNAEKFKDEAQQEVLGVKEVAKKADSGSVTRSTIMASVQEAIEHAAAAEKAWKGAVQAQDRAKIAYSEFMKTQSCRDWKTAYDKKMVTVNKNTIEVQVQERHDPSKMPPGLSSAEQKKWLQQFDIVKKQIPVLKYLKQSETIQNIGGVTRMAIDKEKVISAKNQVKAFIGKFFDLNQNWTEKEFKTGFP